MILSRVCDGLSEFSLSDPQNGMYLAYGIVYGLLWQNNIKRASI